MSAKTRFSGVLKNAQDLPAEPDAAAAPQQPGAVPSAAPRKLGRPPGKKTDPAYRQVTVYLQEDIHRSARKLLLDERRQFSDLVNHLVAEWVRNKAHTQ